MFVHHEMYLTLPLAIRGWCDVAPIDLLRR